MSPTFLLPRTGFPGLAWNKPVGSNGGCHKDRTWKGAREARGRGGEGAVSFRGCQLEHSEWVAPRGAPHFQMRLIISGKSGNNISRDDKSRENLPLALTFGLLAGGFR